MKNKPMYFFKITFTYVQKNKLYADFFDYAKQVDGTLMDSPEALHNFSFKMEAELDRLHIKHKRCKPIRFGKLYNRTGDNANCTSVYVSGSWHGMIYKVNHHETYKP